MPRHPSEYGNLLRALIAEHQADCWLVNTGWTGGAFGTGSRMPIKATRALLNAALDGSLANVEMRIVPHFKIRVPVAVPKNYGPVDAKILNPRDTWADKAAYDAQARKLVTMFRENFKKFEAHVSQDVLQAAPELAEAAE
jgi:phosphoenolpyruvate carboxykinase (ATP)